MKTSSGEWAGLKSFCWIEIGSRCDTKVALLVSKENENVKRDRVI